MSLRLQKAYNLEKIARFSIGVNVWQLNKYMINIHIQTHEGDKTSYTMSTQEPVPLYTFQGRV